MGKQAKSGKEKRHKIANKKPSSRLKILSLSELEDLTSEKQSKTKLTISNSDDSEWRLVHFSPREGDINAASSLNWSIGGYREAEIRFDPINPLKIFWKFSITVIEYDSSAKTEKSGANSQKVALKPEFHNVFPWPVTGATGYFRSLRTAYNSQYTNDLELLNVAKLDELNTIQSLDMALNPDEDYLKEVKDWGRVPLYNNYGFGKHYLKESLGAVPNLNYYDESCPVTFPSNEGYHYGYGSLPLAPFQKFSPRIAERMKLNSGGSSREKLNSIIFPPRTSFSFCLEKTPPANYLHSWFFPSYTDRMGSKQESINFVDYRTFTTADQSKTFLIKEGHCEVQSVVIQAYIRSVAYLPAKRLSLFDTYCTVRRLHEHLLDSNRYPVISYYNDTRSLGLGFVLTFRRALDLDEDPTQKHSFCSNTCFRPNNLEEIEILEGGDQGGDPTVYNDMSIKGLSAKKTDFTMARYSSAICREGFISSKRSRTFWQLPYNETVSKKNDSIGDVGVSNYFPFSLLSSKSRKKFVYYSTHGLRSENLLIKLKFTEPPTKSWYLVVISEYLVKIKFDTLTGAPTFKFVED